MKKVTILSLLLCIFALFLHVWLRYVQPAYFATKKPLVIILTTTGGGGNLEASKALESYLQNDYDVELCYIFKELYGSGEDFYNLFIPGKHFNVLRWIYSIGTWYMQFQKKKINTLLYDHFTSRKPHLIISVIPIVNNIVLDVAQRLDIPFLLMPTDLDIKPYIMKIKEPTYKKFYIGLPFDNEETHTYAAEAFIPTDHVVTVGAPIKKDFLINKNKDALRQEFGIEPNKSVIMVLMGSHGSDEMKRYVSELCKVTPPIHIIACIGKNEKIKQDLEKISLPEHITLSIVGFTKRIADYMAVSDMLITKSGTLSVCEALYMNLPLLLDATSTLLPWEEFNHYLIKKHNYGDLIKKFSAVAPLVTNLIEDNNQLQDYKRNIQQLQKKDCSVEVPLLVKKILSQE